MPQKILCCGDRNWTDYNKIYAHLSTYPDGSIVIHGCANGADSLSGVAARHIGFRVIEVPANWEKYGRAAGPIRNTEMLRLHPDVVLAFHSNIAASRGTKNCINQAKRMGIPVCLVE
jgi:hypothetical protein